MQNRFVDEFNKYIEAVYPEGVTDDQRKQLYLCFHAGAICMFSNLCKVVEVAGNDPAAGTAGVQALKNEAMANCEAFTSQLGTTQN